jgi:hypothetical protein
MEPVERVSGDLPTRPNLEPQSSDEYELAPVLVPGIAVESTRNSINTGPPHVMESHLSDEYIPPSSDTVLAEAKWIGRQAFGRNYSSTSTVYMESSIEHPDRDQICFW